MADRPHLIAELDPELATAARDLARRLRESPRPRELKSEAAELVVRLTIAGLESHFLRPVERLGLGFVALSTVRLGLKTSGQGVGVLVRRIFDGMDDEKLRGVADTLSATVVDLEE
ncbi:MAG: hypothetical protein IPJ17_13550 [Holophagales bacterium]|nr:MAG: hypothetical protein IPJ17_13550 [Holophagales bacterium]